MIRLLASIVFSFTVCGLSLAGEAAPPPLPKAPDGFKIELLTAAPQINAPSAIAVSPAGEIYFGEDENNVRGNKPGTGRIKMLVDKGDGKFEPRPFFEGCNGPRGMCFVDGVLYVVHTPTLAAYHNEKHEDKPNKVETLITGLGPPVEKVAPDHSINGVRMAIDGWLYISCGDQGVPNGEGTDGSKVQLHAGGVVRVRPDGSELEMYASGTRNCYDISIDPYLNGFARDNTNDGGGWDVRFHHLTQSAEYGYPSYYKSYQDEMMVCLADYGGGSGTGSIFIQEPGFPAGFGNNVYTCDWGRGWLYRHELEPNGSTFKVKQNEFIKFKRPTDLDVDGRGRVYLADWGNHDYGKAKQANGMIYRFMASGNALPEVPDLEKAGEQDLLKYLTTESMVLRLNAQRKLLKIGAKPDVLAELEKIALGSAPLYGRVAALFTLKQLLGAKAQETLIKLADKPELREFALRALTDRQKEMAGLKPDLFVKALSDTDPRVRVQAVICLGRLGDASAIPALMPLTTDGDLRLAHVAMKSLRTLKAIDASIAAIDPKQRTQSDAALRTLRMLHEPQTVAGLKAKLDTVTEPNLRAQIVKTLARLYYKEAAWDGSWWGIRPDTRGPYFKQAAWDGSPAIGAILVAELNSDNEARQRVALDALGTFRISDKDCGAALTKLSDTPGPLQADATRALIRSNALGKDALGVVEKIASNNAVDATLRAQAVQALQFMPGMERAPVLFRIAEKADLPLETRAAAYAVLFKIKDKAVMEPLGKAWPDATKAEALIQAVRNTGDEGQLKNVKGLADNANPAVKLAALSCLAAFGDAGALDKLLGLCASGDQKAPALHALASISTTKLGQQDIGKMAEKVVALAEANAATPDAPTTHDAISAARMFAGDPRLAAEGGPKLIARIPRPKGSAKLIGELPLEEVVKEVQTIKGDKTQGRQFFIRQICVNCHTTSPDEKPKGPYLGDVGDKYNRKELIQSITNPSATIAQGYETNIVLLKDGSRVEGFVGRETGEEIEIRNIAGEVKVVAKADIKKRAEQAGSLMPVGVVNTLTVEEFASLLAYLESMRSQ